MKPISEIIMEMEEAKIQRIYRCACCDIGITQRQYYFSTLCGYCDTGKCYEDRAEGHFYFPMAVRKMFGRCANCGHDSQVILKKIQTGRGKFQEEMYKIKELDVHYLVHYEKNVAVCDVEGCGCKKAKTMDAKRINKRAYELIAKTDMEDMSNVVK